MAKKPIRTKKTQTKKGTNWLLIGGVAVVGIIGLFGLLYLALREPDSTRQSLAEYCDSSDGNCVGYGDEAAPITLVEVSDFGCPHCRAFHQEKAPTLMERYVDTGDVRWLFVPYALRAETVPASNAALCANEQGQYVEFADALFNTEPAEQALTRNGFIAAAEEVGLDIDSFTTCLEDGRYNRVVTTNQEAARRAGVSATPSFFVNDVIIRGNVPMEEFERRFQQILSS
jgi:protein-disulfide isomerase